jgi:putative DNA primase/helicase
LLTPYFKDRHVIILPDADGDGRAHGKKVARAIDGVAASLRVLDLYPDRDDGSDVADWIADDTAGAKLAKLAKEAPLWESSADDGDDVGGGDDDADADAEIARLAKLKPLDYERERKEVAQRLGIRASMLDKLVQAVRGDPAKEAAPPLYEHWKVEGANEPVDGAALLQAIRAAIREYVFMSDDQSLVVALWIVFSWLHEHENVITHSPILFVTSAERDSGKTTLLGVVNFLTRRSLQSVDISGAALFRSIAKWQPTFIVDEADDALADNIDLRSVINSGWTRGQGVIRCHPDTHEPELFGTFAPKVVAMKGRNLPDTTLSRSIVINMKPARAGDPNEKVADFNFCDTPELARLRSQLLRWATDNADALAKITPETPPGFHNRRRANWVPLLRIAEACNVKEAARKAALAIEQVADTFDASNGVELLRTIKAIFDALAKSKDQARPKDRISSKDLMRILVGDPTAPWAIYNKGKAINERQVADLLSRTASARRQSDSGPTIEATPKATCWRCSRTLSSASAHHLASPPRIYPQQPQQTCFHWTIRNFHPQQAMPMLRMKKPKIPSISMMLRMLRQKRGVRAMTSLHR